ncbi:unnamed protein product [Acanthosepion pharaonis]|uniref:Uncharacterized protein n=1 Tax=Acanthosepion pharaonis TaxID=158019 RepID=A0A812E2L1_ACAPH|nr:unnamed protein product [Sepia pharaonis]
MGFDGVRGGRSQQRERTRPILAPRRVEDLNLYATLGADFAKFERSVRVRNLRWTSSHRNVAIEPYFLPSKPIARPLAGASFAPSIPCWCPDFASRSSGPATPRNRARTLKPLCAGIGRLNIAATKCRRIQGRSAKAYSYRRMTVTFTFGGVAIPSSVPDRRCRRERLPVWRGEGRNDLRDSPASAVSARSASPRTPAPPTAATTRIGKAPSISRFFNRRPNRTNG